MFLPAALAWLLLLLSVSAANAEGLVDDYEIIEAESGVSEFTADLTNLLTKIQSKALLIQTERMIIEKRKHQPPAELQKTNLRHSRAYVWLAKYAEREGLLSYAKAFKLLAESTNELALSTTSVPDMAAAFQEASVLIEAEPKSNTDEEMKATTAEREEFTIMYAEGLWDAMGVRAAYELAQAN